MVQNVGGGNKSKGLARKFVVQAQNQGGGGKTVRTVKESGEQYAIVQKHLGNCMCTVFCSDGYRRLCIIRKKFTGRRKTDNNISSGSVVMVGLHDYSGGSGGDAGKSAGSDVKRCDLLYVYSEQEKEKLRKVCDLSKLSASLDDQPKHGQPKQCQEQPFESEVLFMTAGTGVFNKYLNNETCGGGVAGSGAALLGDEEGARRSTGTGNGKGNGNNKVISSSDWLDDMPSCDEESDCDEDEGCKQEGEGEGERAGSDSSESETESDEPDSAPADTRYTKNANTNTNNNTNTKAKAKVRAVVNIDDI